MNYTTSNISFACRSSKANKKGEAPIELVLNMNGTRTYLTLPMKMSADKFKKDMCSKRNNQTKEFCETAKAKVNGIIADLWKYGMAVTTENIKKAFLEGISNIYTLKDMFDDYLHILYTKSTSSVGSYKKYEYARDLFFTLVENKSANELTNADILLYEAEVNKKFKESTAAAYMTRLKAFVTFAINNNKIQTNPFVGVKIKKAKSNIEIMTDAEYLTMKEKEITIDRLSKVRDFCILQANCGLAYTDLANLTKEDFIKTGDSVIINKNRQKTNVEFCTVVLNDGVEILEKYDYDIKKMVVSNQKMNAYLKEIQDICGISVNLHTHMFRHFYATKLIRSGVSMPVVQKCMGHSSIKMTINTYTHLIKDDIVNEVKKHVS